MESNWRLDHVGLIARDLDETIDYIHSLGIALSIGEHFESLGPSVAERERNRHLSEVFIYGKRIDTSGPFHVRMLNWNFLIGSLKLEVIGHPDASGKDSNSEFLRSYGEGISHICFNVPDIKGETAKLVEKGCPVILSLGNKGGVLYETYLDTRKFGNIVISFRPPATEGEIAWVTNPMASNWKFHHVGVVVRDMDSTVDYYQSLGIGTFQPEVMFDSSSFTDFRVHGKPADTIVKARRRMFQIVGPVGCEFIQPLEGEAIYKESLDRRGEGINDFAFIVDDLDEETARLAEKQVPVILSGKTQAGSAFAYFDTCRFGGTMLELIQS